MPKRAGLTFKIFIFTMSVITLATAVPLGALWLVLPGYYLSQKGKLLEQNADALEQRLSGTDSKEECAQIISDFSSANNSSVLSFNENEQLLPELSSPFFGHAPANAAQVRIISSAAGGAFASKEIRVIGPGAPGEAGVRPGIMASFVQYDGSSAMATRYPKNGVVERVMIGATLQPIGEAKSVIMSLTPYLFGLNVIVALAAAGLFARRLTKPILSISHAAERMRGMEPGALSEVRTGDELEQLSRNLDSLYVSLCDNIDGLKLEMGKTARLEQSKTDFMRAAGHELKTPIAALAGMIEGMIDNIGAYKNREKYLGESQKQVAKLSKLVGEILAASKSESLPPEPATGPVDIRGLLEEAMRMYSVAINDKQLRVSVTGSTFVHETDRHTLLFAFSNIISNAVNYTSPGGVVNIRFEGGGRLSVENECEPVDERLLPKLFEPFFTLDYSRSGGAGGTGLGLYIVKKNLEALGLSAEIRNSAIGLCVDVNFPRE